MTVQLSSSLTALLSSLTLELFSVLVSPDSSTALMAEMLTDSLVAFISYSLNVSSTILCACIQTDNPKKGNKNVQRLSVLQLTIQLLSGFRHRLLAYLTLRLTVQMLSALTLKLLT